MDKQYFLNSLKEYRDTGIEQQIDYKRAYYYSLITHSTAIEGSTLTEVENQLLFDEGITAKGKNIIEQNMNIDLKAAYDRCFELIKEYTPFTKDLLKELSALVMRRTGGSFSSLAGNFDSSKGEFRKLNVTAGFGGKSYLGFEKIDTRLNQFCQEFNERRKSLLETPDEYEAYCLSFDVHNSLVAIHPWVDGNGRMSRLMMNYIQFEFNLPPSIILKEDKVEYINALVKSREEESYIPFREFMFSSHIRYMKEAIEQYTKEINRNGFRR